MLRKIGGVVAGILVAIVTIMLVEMIGKQISPMPAMRNVSLSDIEATKAAAAAAIAAAPASALAFVVTAWFAGALLGGYVAGRIARTTWAPGVVAGFVVVAGLGNILMIPHPLWMQVSALLAPLLGGFIASRLVAARIAHPVVAPDAHV